MSVHVLRQSYDSEKKHDFDTNCGSPALWVKGTSGLF